MRKESRALLLIAVIFITVIAGTFLVSLAKANPYHNIYIDNEAATPLDAAPPKVALLSNVSDVYGKNAISFKVNVTASGETLTISLTGQPIQYYSPFIAAIYYTADWRQDKTVIYDEHDVPVFNEYHAAIRTAQFWPIINLTNIPDGKHSVIVSAVERVPYRYVQGDYAGNALSYDVYLYGYNVTGALAINFTVDTTPPSITSISPENKTYTLVDGASLDIPLAFSINEPASQITYSLDNQANATINGNTTLTGLTEGWHTLTVYANDSPGNAGSSETLTFTIAEPEPFLTAYVAAVSVGSAAVVVAGLLVYFKRSNQRTKEA